MLFYDKMIYNQYSVSDFLNDESFIDWVKDETTNPDLNEWVLSNPDSLTELNEAKRIVRSFKFKTDLPSSKIQAQIWNSISDQINPTYNLRKSYAWIYKVAAVLVFFFMIGLTLYFYNAINLGFSKIAMTAVENGKSEKKKVILPDGSVVWLNAESKLYFPEKFDTDKRNVILEGEAFFDVIKNKNAPFTVKTEQIDIRVLGTSFNVRSYTDDDLIETTLVTGAVEIKNKVNLDADVEKTIKLTPNHQAVYSKTNKVINLTQVDTKYYTSWKEGQLLFSNESLIVVAKKLSKWYGKEIKIENSEAIRNCRITLKIDKECIDQVIEILKLTTPIDVSYQSNGDILIKGSSSCI